MTFAAYQRHLTEDFRSRKTGQALQADSASDYVSRLRRLQMALRLPIESAQHLVVRALADGLAGDPRVAAADLPERFIGDVRPALESYAAFLERESGPPAQTEPLPEEPATESAALTKTRLGQERFRGDLFRMWEGRCAVTALRHPELLRASHIKPWAESDDRERLDAFNGLLLAVHLDAMFDRRMISFDHAGDMLISPRLSGDDRAVFGLTSQPRPVLLSARHLTYMDHHRTRFLSGEQDFPPSG